MAATIQSIRDKVAGGERLSREDGVFLFGTPPPDGLGRASSPDIHDLGELADAVRRRKNGDAAYFVNNLHINPTNVCVSGCNFCAFSTRSESDPRSYVTRIEPLLAKLAGLDLSRVTEFHVTGGLHPALPFDYYRDLLAALSQAYPRISLKAYTAVELDWFSRLTGLTIDGVLDELIAAGLASVPGGGAEIFDPAIRKRICPGKITGERWLDIHRSVHKRGLRSTATMLYNHVETTESKVDHLIALRDLQDESHGFTAFIPLAFHPENTPYRDVRFSSGLSDLRHVAVARLMLDNFDHIKAYWMMIGLKTAQVALCFGADDLDGTIVEEKISHAAGARTPQGVTEADLVAAIRETGFIPLRRDSVYNVVERYDAVAAAV
jgi:aminodeoxyfutalosine synthase